VPETALDTLDSMREQGASEAEVAEQAAELEKQYTPYSEQGTIFLAANNDIRTAEVRAKSRPELIADLQIARATGNRKATEIAVEQLRRIKEAGYGLTQPEVRALLAEGKTKEEVDAIAKQKAEAAAPNRELEQATGITQTVKSATQQDASDARAAAYGEMVSILNRFNMGMAKRAELEAARDKVLDNLVLDINTTRATPMDDSQERQVRNDAGTYLRDLITRFGDTRNLVQTGARKQPQFYPAQKATGEFTQQGQPGITVESRAPGRQTFANPFAAVESIQEGLNVLRRNAIGETATNFEPLGAYKANVNRMLAQLPANLSPEKKALADAIDSNKATLLSNQVRAQDVAEWLYKTRVGSDTKELDAVVNAHLADLEQGKRSETETTRTGEIKRAVQKDMFPDEELQGKQFDTAAEFEDYLASDTLHSIRQEIGPVAPTMARLQKQLQPLQRRADNLATAIEALRSKHEALQSQQKVFAEETKAEAAQRLAKAEELYANATNRMAVLQRQLDMEFVPFQIEYLSTQEKLKEAVDYSKDLSDTIAQNLEKFQGAKTEVKTAMNAVIAAKQAVVDAAGKDVSKSNWDGMRTAQQNVVKTSAKLESLRAQLPDALNAFLKRDRFFQAKLAAELKTIATLDAEFKKAKNALARAAAGQERRKVVKQAKAEIVETRTGIRTTREKNEADALAAYEIQKDFVEQEKALGQRAVRAEVLKTKTEERIAAAKKPLEQLAQRRAAPAQTAAKESFAEAMNRAETLSDKLAVIAAAKPGAATQSEREEIDAAVRKLNNERADRLNQILGETVSFEAYRTALADIDTIGPRLEELTAKSTDETLPKTTRDKANREIKKLDMARKFLAASGEGQTELRLQAEVELAKLQKKILHQEELVAENPTKTRKQELAKSKRAAKAQQQILKQFASRSERTPIATRAEKETRAAEAMANEFLERSAAIAQEGTMGKLENRKRGPVVKKGTQPGNIRTGIEATEKERLLAPRNPIEQSGKRQESMPLSDKKLVLEANKVAKERLANLEQLTEEDLAVLAEDKKIDLLEAAILMRKNLERNLADVNDRIEFAKQSPNLLLKNVDYTKKLAKEKSGIERNLAAAKKNETTLQNQFEEALEAEEPEGKPIKVSKAAADRAAAMEDTSIDDTDNLLLSRGTPTKALSVKEVEAELAKAMGEPVTGRPREAQVSRVLGVYQTVEDALADVGMYIQVPADTKGFVFDEQAYLIADNIGKGEALGILLHEVGVHIGFRNFFNAGQFKALVGTVRSWANRNDGSLESKVGKAAIARAEAAQTSAENMDDEILAYAVEEAVKAGVSPAGVTKRSAIHNWLRMIVDAFKNALKTLGFNPTNLTTGDLVNFAYGCAQLELKGTWHGTAATFEKFDHAYMGTGEGNQAYGYGTYRAQNAGVAKYYRDMMSSRQNKKTDAWWALPEIQKWHASTVDDPIYKGKNFSEMLKAGEKDPAYIVAAQIFENEPTPAPYFSTEAELRDWWDLELHTYVRVAEFRVNKGRANLAAGEPINTKNLERTEELLTAAKKMSAADFDYSGNLPPVPFPNLKGNLLRVLHGAKETAYLNLDAEYGGQSKEVSKGLLAAFSAMTPEQKIKFNNHTKGITNPDGKFLYDAFKLALGSQKAASSLLAANGIVGNKFFDAPTRKAGLRGEAAEFNYVDFLDKDQGPQVLGENLKPLGQASGPLFSRAAKYGVDNALTQLAQDAVFDGSNSTEKVMDNLGLKFEMNYVDMRAALRKVLGIGAKAFGDSRLFQQAMFSYTDADQKMSLTYAALNEGYLKLTTDSKGFKFIESSGKESAKDVFVATGNIPNKYGDEAGKVGLATAYMAAQRAANKGLSKLDLDALGLTEEKMAAALAAADADPELKNALEKVRETYNAYNEGMVRMVQGSGAISKAFADELLKDKDYVPYYRVRPDGTAVLVLGNDRTITVGDIKHQPWLRELKGGETKILPITQSIPRNTMLLVSMATSNMARRNFAYAMQEIGRGQGEVDPRTGEARNLMSILSGKGPDDPSIIRFKQEPDPNKKDDKGDRYIRIQTKGTVAEGVPAELIIKSMEGAPLTLPAFLKWGGIAGDILRKGVTRMPMYLIRQLFRDPMAAAATSGLDYGMFTAVYKANKEFLKMTFAESKTASTMLKKGLIQSGVFTGDPDDVETMALQLVSGKDFNIINKVCREADKLAMNADAATRSLVYENAINNGMSEAEAKFAVQESMNFHKRGLSAGTQYLSRMIPFFNAQIQGLNVLYKAGSGQMPFEHQLQIKQKFYNNALFLVAGGLAYAMAMQDDEYYKNAKPKDRYSNFFLHTPFTDEPLKLPIPYEFGWFFSMGAAAADAMAGETDGTQQLKALQSMLVGAIPGSSSMGMPQIFKPFAEVWANKDFNTGFALESTRLRGKSTEERYNANTTELAKAMSQFAPVLSPIQIERIVGGYLGPLPILVAAATNGLFRDGDVEPVTKNMSEMPFFGSGFQKKYGGADSDVMYRLADEALQAKRDFDSMKREGRIADAQEYLQDHRTELRVAPLALQYQKLMGNFRTMEERIRGSTIPGDEKRKRIDDIQKRRQELAEKFENRIKELTT
jgi:hypothetical protein